MWDGRVCQARGNSDGVLPLAFGSLIVRVALWWDIVAVNARARIYIHTHTHKHLLRHVNTQT